MSVPGPRQLSLSLPEPPRIYPPGTYLVTDANRTAAAFARGFETSGELFLVICGPRGAGKTHLLHEVFGAAAIARSLDEAFARTNEDQLALDDCSAISEPLSFLRFIEQRKDARRRTILAGEGRPRAWSRGLKDLETRLEALPRTSLADPDEALLAAVLAQHFTSRRLRTIADLAAYVAPRIPRSFAAAAAFAEGAAAAAHAGESINLATAKKVIANLFEAPLQS
jgi:chromosomal replication initiation ATPase DnaA